MHEGDAQRQYAAVPKIKVDNPVVDLDGDEMTRCAATAHLPPQSLQSPHEAPSCIRALLSSFLGGNHLFTELVAELQLVGIKILSVGDGPRSKCWKATCGRGNERRWVEMHVSRALVELVGHIAPSLP